MSCNKINQSYGLSYDETLFLSYQKIPKVMIAFCYSKEDDLYCLEDSINVNSKLLVLLVKVARTEKSSKSGENKRCRIKDVLKRCYCRIKDVL